ncbi:hypothetical protein Lser_V15G25294 [Lactuca serriola]
MDGNNQILPIAFGIGKTESRESWTWFLSRLKECFGDMPYLAIISDRANSIEMDIQAMFPNAYHRFCCHHLLMNMRTKIRKQQRMEILFWEAAKAYREFDFKESLSRLRHALNDDCQRIGNERWSRSCFPMVRYNIMTSKSVESVNALSRDSRKLLITMLIDFFQATMLQWGCQRHNVGAESKKDVIEYAEKGIDRRINKSSGFRVYQIHQRRYEVSDQMKNGIVNLESRHCTCEKWQLSGIPCTHAMTVFKELRYQHYNAWVSSYFTMETYHSTYAGLVFPVPVPTKYEEQNEFMVVFPLLMDE